jgi:LCP family protein required for cell wall assembly
MGKGKVVLAFLAILVILPIIFFLVLRSIFFSKFDYGNIKSSNGITSILILGKGGEGHTAPDLTDTMMVAFLSGNSKKVSILSLPRDIWIPAIRAKLNSAYYWGKQKSNNNFELVNTSVEEIIDLPISYTVVVDFSLFKDLINTLGGINVVVDNSFIDSKYPITGKENDLCEDDKKNLSSIKTYACRYETISFEKGVIKMDGETALKFVRSRNSEGPEGTDLAREVRQQKVIRAIKEKVLSKEIILNPLKLKEIYDITISHVETNLDNKSLLILGRLVFESRNNVYFFSIPEKFLEISQNLKKYDYQYVFISKSGSWKDFSTTLPSQIY